MSTEPNADMPIIDRPERHRFELAVDGEVAFVQYRRARARLYLLHTEVPPALRGRNIGARLVRDVLELARREGSIVVPYCPYVRAFIEKHPEYAVLTRARDAAP